MRWVTPGGGAANHRDDFVPGIDQRLRGRPANLAGGAEQAEAAHARRAAFADMIWRPSAA